MDEKKAGVIPVALEKSELPSGASAFLPLDARAASLEEAYARCLVFCRSHYENFPVASWLLPAGKRKPIAAIYAFARSADDFADEPGLGPEERLRLLAAWRARLKQCRARHDSHPIFWALADALERFDLPLEPLERLLTAFEMDVTKNRYRTFEDLLAYCRHSANPMGELVLRVFGQWNDRRAPWSDAICTALQLANFWQDVTVDAQKSRIYIPLNDLETFRVSEKEVLEGPPSEALREIMAFQVDRAWTLFRHGRALCDDVSPDLGRELRLVWLGGTRILEKIDRQKWDVWTRRPRLGAADALPLFWRWMFWRLGPGL